jgi:nucleoside-diphosphate-sugar epimerase
MSEARIMSERINVILGGEGLIGKALDRKLSALGERTIVYDIKSGFDLRARVPEEFPRSAYYWFLAWDVGGAKYIMDPKAQTDILRSNLRLCDKVFDWLATRKAEFTFTSTQMVNYPNAYGISKGVGEYWARLLEHGLIARLWNVYDAEEPSVRSHVIPDLVQQGSDGTIRLQTRGTERRRFLHADDCADGLIRHRETGQRLADLTAGEWTSIKTVAGIIGELMRARVVPGPSEGYETLIEPVNLLPGWSPRISLRAGLEAVIGKMREKGWT